LAIDCLGEDDPLAAAEALIAEGRAREVADALAVRLAAGRGGLLARLMRTRALLAAGDAPAALAEAREVAALHPAAAPAALALGEALLGAGLLPTAIAELQRAVRIDPGLDAARLRLGEAWLAAGEPGKVLDAIAPLEESAATRALTEAAAAIRAAPRSDPGYVRHLFDQFAADYDLRMRGPLRYAAPEILSDLAALVMMGRGGLAVLDLGCGTGLAGAAFRARAARLDGVDLSPLMIEKARARGIYDALEVADLETALAAPGPSYDLILAADTLVYLGDLERVFRAAAARLAPEGYFLFTVEAAEGTSFELGPKRRWRHGEAYLRKVAAGAGLGLAALVAADVRHEAGVPVNGYAVALAAL
jgi:predicted TPR repeat methyltransferase